MDVPSRLRIGSFWYDVVLDDAAVNKKALENPAAKALGYFDADERVIYMLENTRHQVVLFHEVIHAVVEFSGAGAGRADGFSEEAWTRTIEQPLLAVLRDNPELVAFLTADEESDTLPEGSGVPAPLA